MSVAKLVKLDKKTQALFVNDTNQDLVLHVWQEIHQKLTASIDGSVGIGVGASIAGSGELSLSGRRSVEHEHRFTQTPQSKQMLPKASSTCVTLVGKEPHVYVDCLALFDKRWIGVCENKVVRRGETVTFTAEQLRCAVDLAVASELSAPVVAAPALVPTAATAAASTPPLDVDLEFESAPFFSAGFSDADALARLSSGGNAHAFMMCRRVREEGWKIVFVRDGSLSRVDVSIGKDGFEANGRTFHQMGDLLAELRLFAPKGVRSLERTDPARRLFHPFATKESALSALQSAPNDTLVARPSNNYENGVVLDVKRKSGIQKLLARRERGGWFLELNPTLYDTLDDLLCKSMPRVDLEASAALKNKR
jgi:hypothetical protein